MDKKELIKKYQETIKELHYEIEVDYFELKENKWYSQDTRTILHQIACINKQIELMRAIYYLTLK